MPDTEIPDLTAVSSVAGANEFIVDEAGTSKKASATQVAEFVFDSVPLKTSAPSAPAEGLKLYARNRAGRRTLDMVGPSGIDVSLQPALFGNNVVLWLPGTGTTVSIGFGDTWTARNAGTSAAQSHPTRASTNILTQMKRALFGTGTTATGSSGIQSTNLAAWRGNAAGLGGFFFFARLAMETSASDIRFMVGLSSLNAAINGEPSSQMGSGIVIGADSTDTNIQVISRDGTTAHKTDTGVSKTATGTVLDFYAFAPPNGSDIKVRVVNVGTGAVAVDNVAKTSNLPAAATFMYVQAQIQSVTGTTAKTLALNRLYLETDT